MAASLAGIALAPRLWVLLVAVVPLGYSLPLLIVAFTTLLQRRTPHRLIGRVSATAETLTGIPQALSLALGALLVTLLSYHLIFTIMALTTAAAAAYLARTQRRDRAAPAHELNRPPAEHAPPDPAASVVMTSPPSPDV